MTRYRSEQSRVLRRQLTLHTIIVWVAYTAVFALFALMLNAWVVPQIAKFVVDQTAEVRVYDPASYLEQYPLDELLYQYLLMVRSENVAYELLWADSSVSDAAVEGLEGNEASEIELDGGAKDQIAIATTSAPSEAVNGESSVESYRIVDVDVLSEHATEADANAEEASTPKDWKEQPIGLIAVKARKDDGTFKDETTYVELTPWYLAYTAAMRDYQTRDQEGTWERLPLHTGRADDYEPFEARELTTYFALKQLKIPAAVLLYLFGCLCIALVELRRALRCFDDLSEAVVGLMTDRTKPVELPPDLAIAQSELNKIRLEALSDERAAAAAEQRKNELVAYLAHDIRTPLTSVVGYLSLLNEAGELPSEQRQKFTHTAFLKAESLEGLINEFFEITRYNLQSIPIERSTVEVRLLLQQVADELYPQATQRNVSITVDAAAGMTFFVDAAKLARALGNVLRNAVAYADEDTTVTVKAVHEGDTWNISVTDTGREISPVHLETIFEKFYREDAARGTNSGGVGLGLAIAREIVNAHGGTISATSKGDVTTFTIALVDQPE